MIGFLLINKPKNISSFQCSRHLKKILPPKTKIGHTGTLDPFATGLLIICIGKEATRLSHILMNHSKEYIFTAKLGELTDTLDNTGTIIERQKELPISEEQLAKAIESLGNSYEQIPPIFSALKHQGQPLYKLARAGKISSEKIQEITKQKARTVTLHKITIENVNSPFFTLKALVSKGTYIRSLANDIASNLNLYATCHELQRTAISPFQISKAHTLYEFKTIDDIKEKIISIENVNEYLDIF